ncbi:Signal recognition particle 19 kDa protein [Gryllus bimaculatus]|nr:Signal recognition particle 19 kDa protein [Gryllus bimaculatus]
MCTRWICIYPAYLNSRKTLAEGRRVPKDVVSSFIKRILKAIENPTHQEIRDVLAAAGLRIGVEDKMYSRERSKELLFRGRIRVQLKNDDGCLFNPNFPTRDSVMLHACQMIPKLKTRQGKQGGDQGQSQGGGSGSGAKKKKGRR